MKNLFLLLFLFFFAFANAQNIPDSASIDKNRVSFNLIAPLSLVNPGLQLNYERIIENNYSAHTTVKYINNFNAENFKRGAWDRGIKGISIAIGMNFGIDATSIFDHSYGFRTEYFNTIDKVYDEVDVNDGEYTQYENFQLKTVAYFISISQSFQLKLSNSIILKLYYDLGLFYKVVESDLPANKEYQKSFAISETILDKNIKAGTYSYPRASGGFSIVFAF